MNRIIKKLFIRISIARLIAELEELDLLYREGRSDEYLDKVSHFLIILQSQEHIISSVFPTMPAIFQEPVLSIKRCIDQQNAEQVRNHLLILRTAFDKVYSSVNFHANSTIRKLSFSLPLILILALFAFTFKPLREKYVNELAKDDLLKNEEVYASQTVADILHLKKALQQYFKDNGHFPNTSSIWYGLISPFGEAKTDWIPGLAPKYIPTLPNDPRIYRQPIEQYMYQSDGKDYKLIAHFPVRMSAMISQHPELADPRRPSWAIGCWSDGAKTW